MSDEDGALFKVTPMTIRFDLKDAEVEVGSFTVTNLTDEPFVIKLSTSPYYVDENYNATFSIDNEYTKLSHWISFQNNGEVVSEFSRVLGANETETIVYQIDMPAGATDRSQYAVIFVEAEDQSEVEGVVLNSRIGVTVCGQTDKVTASGQIGEVKIDEFITSGNLDVGTTVQNTGSISFEAKETVRVTNLFGTELYNVEDRTEILPMTTRDVEVEWGGTPMMGVLNVEYTIEASDQTISGTQTVVKLPIVLILVGVAALVAAIVAAVLVIRGRKKRKASEATTKSPERRRKFLKKSKK